ncbi:MAG: LysR family transcriptional regulator substrate-binding protein, partial [Pseudomonadota bacterium]
FDIGISYTEADGASDAESHGLAAPRPLYRESYVLLAPNGLVEAGKRRLSWAEAATLPLALLTPDMKNRQIIDQAFRHAGVSPRPVFETNSISTLHAFLAEAGVATIAPANAARSAPLPGTDAMPETVILDLVEPDLRRVVAALVPDDRFEPPGVTAVLQGAAKVAAEMSAVGRRRPKR